MNDEYICLNCTGITDGQCWNCDGKSYFRALEWISVKDRLPEKNKNVILAAEGLTHQVCYGFYYCGMFHIFYTNGASPNNRVTHWMPLPAPPEAV